ncbi:hypothetical protein L1987_01066 [Smallanthus sonchifolius]|uniref:Uncharacterized protein n=1 Tax=Smallanthus sonchifolius TaxID=185202 RepID=A0ACB9K486_9ASTR|nr:hypothetical protein L1987_01066 [Smallanthus sonchifolius]
MQPESFKHVQNSASFAEIVKRKQFKEDTETESGAPIVILYEEDCRKLDDNSRILMGSVWDINCFENLNALVEKEGFFEVEIKYMGGAWIWMGFESEEVALKFKENEELNVFFKVIRTVDEEFVLDEKIVWLELSGLPLFAWTEKAFLKIVGEWGEVLFVDDVKDEAMSIGQVCVRTKVGLHQLEKRKVMVKGKSLCHGH